MKLSHALATAIAVTTLTLTACQTTEKKAEAPKGPSDAQIAAIVVTANQVDVDTGKLAQKKARHPEVKKFAALMVTDHEAVNQTAIALAKKLNLTPEENETSQSLKQGGVDQIAKLTVLKGKSFDRAYVDHEVKYHQAVIDTLDNTLIPHAKNPELKDLLVKSRPAFIAHLEHAKQVQSKLK